MKRHLILAASAALALGGISVCPALADDAASEQRDQQKSQHTDRQSQQPQQSADRPDAIIVERVVIYGILVPTKDTELPQGFTRTEIKENSGIRSVVAKATELAMEPGDRSKLLDCFVSSDQQRLRDAFKQEDQQLKESVAQVQKAWKHKYGEDFNINQQVALFNQQFTIYEGRISNPTLLSNWPVKQGSEQGGQSGLQHDQSRSSSDRQTDQSKETPSHGYAGTSGGGSSSGASAQGPGGQSAQPGRSGQSDQAAPGGNQQQGNAADQPGMSQRQAAVIVFPGDQNLPESYVSLLKENGNWKIDIPDDVSGQELISKLSFHLNHLSQNADKLPAKSDEAYRHVAHHVMMALYGQDLEKSSKTGGSQQSGERSSQS